jgi:hypothetical protein
VANVADGKHNARRTKSDQSDSPEALIAVQLGTVLDPSLCARYEFGLGVALAVPGSHEQNFVAERISEYVVDIGRAIDFKETRAAGVCPVQTNVE